MCLRQSLVGSLLLSPGSWCAQGSVCALPESVSPVLCKFWCFYSGINGDLLQEGLCHSQICCTQSPCPCPCSRPLPPQETLRYSSGSVPVDWVCILHPCRTARRSNQSILKEISPELSTGSSDAEAETPILGPPDAKNQLIGKDPDAGKDWRREENGRDGWMASPTQWTWVWVGSGSWRWTGMLQPMGLQSPMPLSEWTELLWRLCAFPHNDWWGQQRAF